MIIDIKNAFFSLIGTNTFPWMLYRSVTFRHRFSEEEECWGIFIWDKNIKIIFTTKLVISNITMRRDKQL